MIPEGNKADLDKVNDTVKNAIEFIPVSNLDEVLSISLVNKGKKRVDKINNISKKNINENITDTKTNGVYCKEI